MIGTLAGLATGWPKSIVHAADRLQKRTIPLSGEALSVVGCGTWQIFDVGPSPHERAPLAEVLRALFVGAHLQVQCPR